jgi:murein DD-endopeptidase MepM/ murein hydrolase activator NlpD
MEVSSASYGAYAPEPPARADNIGVAALPAFQPSAATPAAPAPIGVAPAAPAVRSAAYSFDEAPQPRPPAKGETIEVRTGDTIYRLAKRHRLSASALMSANDLANGNIRPGQKLVLPSGGKAIAGATMKKPSTQAERFQAAVPLPATAPAPEGGANPEGSYLVKSGDSLYAIASRHKVALAELQSANGITDPYKVRPGTLLRMPSDAVHSSVPAAAQKAPEPPAVEAQRPVQTAIVPKIINVKPKQVAALQPAETMTDAVPAIGAPAIAASPKGAEEAGIATQAVPAGKFRWPVKGRVVAGFGPKLDGSMNEGVNIAVPLGTDVLAAESGVVAYAGSELKGYGQLILIRHDNGWVTAYAHNDQIHVKRDDRVRRGQVIAKAGKTGTVDQPQLHFEVRQGSVPVDPLIHLEKI